MTAIDTTSFIDNQRELYRAFYRPAWKKHHPQRDYYGENTDSPVNPHSNLYRFTLAGGVVLVLGGAGAILGKKRFMNIIQNLNKQEKGEKKGGIKRAIQTLGDGYFIVDKYKDTGMMVGLQAIDKGFAKIKLGFLKPGEWLINIANFSLRKVTGLSLLAQYNGVNKDLEGVLKTLSNAKKPFADQEKQFLSGLDTTIGNLQSSLGNVREGVKNRFDHIDKEIQEKHVQRFLDDYFVKIPKKGDKWWSRLKANFKVSIANWKKVFEEGRKKNKLDLDVLRSGWEKTQVGLENNVMSTKGNNGKTFKVCLEELDKKIESLSEATKNKNSNKRLKSLVKKLTEIRKNLNNAVKFEVDGRGDGYAGRAIDLFGGGGIQETFMPIGIGAIITHSTIKNSKKDDTPGTITRRFMNTGGVEFLGGLVAMSYLSYWKAINGPKGLMVGLGTALGLNIAKRLYHKITGNESERPKRQQIKNHEAM